MVPIPSDSVVCKFNIKSRCWFTQKSLEIIIFFLLFFITRYKRCDQIEERKARRLSGRTAPKSISLLHFATKYLLSHLVSVLILFYSLIVLSRFCKVRPSEGGHLSAGGTQAMTKETRVAGIRHLVPTQTATVRQYGSSQSVLWSLEFVLAWWIMTLISTTKLYLALPHQQEGGVLDPASTKVI